ncbi:hypothetical protein [Vibrio phage vB_pir03]|nr:hypothetical protein [Vibrio phage vB_pir03]
MGVSLSRSFLFLTFGREPTIEWRTHYVYS